MLKKWLSVILTLTLICTFCYAEDNEVAEKTIREYTGYDDSNYIHDLENDIYNELIDQLNSEDYFIENIDAIYISKEYLDEVAFNSQTNIFFGYSIEDLDNLFEGTRYVFTLGDDNKTNVIPYYVTKEYDDTFETIVRNLAIGGGVIIICATVGIATAPFAPAVSMILLTGVKKGIPAAINKGKAGLLISGAIALAQTGDIEYALKQAALGGSEGFKYGAIIGTVAGGIIEAKGLKGATLNGLTMNEAASIQMETKWPLDAIKSIHSLAESEVYRNAGVVPTQLADGRWIFTKPVDWTLKDSLGRTNITRVLNNLSPIDDTGMPYEVHHMGQKADGPLVMLTNAEHHSKATYSIIHYAEEGKNIADSIWASQRNDYWRTVLHLQTGV